jgi:hypothetical protein
MYLVTGKISRPNLSCSFYTIADTIVPESVRTHWQTAFKDTGKCLFVEITLSPDKLELQTSQYWADEASYADYKNDTLLIAELFNVRNIYWAANGMTGIILSENTV